MGGKEKGVWGKGTGKGVLRADGGMIQALMDTYIIYLVLVKTHNFNAYNLYKRQNITI